MLLTLHDRLDQVQSLVETFHSTLQRIFRALFPLNDAPNGFFPLLNAFRHDARGVEHFVREQLVGGAKVALAFVRVHHPGIDLEEVAGGFPGTHYGERVAMEDHYVAAEWPARKIIRKVEQEISSMRLRCQPRGDTTL
jgi:hypothetical protein